jgi:hypothetical protein
MSSPDSKLGLDGTSLQKLAASAAEAAAAAVNGPPPEEAVGNVTAAAAAAAAAAVAAAAPAEEKGGEEPILQETIAEILATTKPAAAAEEEEAEQEESSKNEPGKKRAARGPRAPLLAPPAGMEGAALPLDDETLEKLRDGSKLVTMNDRDLVPDSLFISMAQMKPCLLAQADKSGCYKDREIGFLGMCCKHCGGTFSRRNGWDILRLLFY